MKNFFGTYIFLFFRCDWSFSLFPFVSHILFLFFFMFLWMTFLPSHSMCLSFTPPPFLYVCVLVILCKMNTVITLLPLEFLFIGIETKHTLTHILIWHKYWEPLTALFHSATRKKKQIQSYSNVDSFLSPYFAQPSHSAFLFALK